MPDAADILRLENLEVHFPIQGGSFDRVLGRPAGAVRAVDGIDLNVRRGEILALVGESGSGKTTVGRVITKLTQPTGGKLLFEGRDMTSVRGSSALRPYRHRVQMIFQDAYQALNPRHKIFDIVAEPLRSLRLVENHAQLTERVSDALAAAGLNPVGDFFARFPHELSGGQRQRVVIAGALAVKPELIVADEPVSMLDVSIRAQILKVLVDLRDKHNMALLFITHDLPLAWLIADRIATPGIPIPSPCATPRPRSAVTQIGPICRFCRARSQAPVVARLKDPQGVIGLGPRNLIRVQNEFGRAPSCWPPPPGWMSAPRCGSRKYSKGPTWNAGGAASDGWCPWISATSCALSSVRCSVACSA